jgi:DNA (cytosine-5)-methyltransferase 1
MKILNLYACLGGNRYLWSDEHEITAVELDPELSRMYQERFPNDTVINGDAHQYLLDHFKEFDLIWTSPPCPTHSRVRMSQKNKDSFKPMFPDMKLYEEILFLEHNFKGKYVVENVIPFYTPLIPAKKRGRHLYWTNFNLPNDLGEREEGKGVISNSVNEVEKLCKFHKIDLTSYKGKQPKNKLARNLVDYEVGKTILDIAMGIVRKQNERQVPLFD